MFILGKRTVFPGGKLTSSSPPCLSWNLGEENNLRTFTREQTGMFLFRVQNYFRVEVIL